MSNTCRNCDCTIPDYADCPYCQYARERLLERLNGGDDGAASWAVIAAMAVHGEREQPERAWWIG